jgi:hypothetical protein
MSLRIDFTELAATQFYLVPHDVYAKVRAELVALAEAVALDFTAGLAGPIWFRVEGFEVKYEVNRQAQHIRVLTIARVRSDNAAMVLANLA